MVANVVIYYTLLLACVLNICVDLSTYLNNKMNLGLFFSSLCVPRSLLLNPSKTVIAWMECTIYQA